MNPTDALQQDWRMYYNGAWMLHRTHGPVQVSVVSSRLYCFTYPNGEKEVEPIKCLASDLECWWPRSGSYNTVNGACYIARMTSRSMRKSAHPNEHYRVQWGRSGQYGMPALMVQLREGPSLITPVFAREVLRKNLTNSVALTHDLILSKDGNDTTVVFKGLRVGILREDEFEADYASAPMARRVTQRLMEVGIL